MTRCTFTGYLAVLFLSCGGAAHAMTDEDYEKAAEQINSRYKPTYDSVQREGENIKKESNSCLIEAGFDADWEITKVSFDLPQVTFKNRELSFHSVKTTFSNKVIAKTKVPKTYFENRNIGFGIKTKVPVIRWEIEEIISKVPELKWDRTSFKTKIPEFRSKRVELKFHILKLKKLKELNIPCKDQEKRAETLSASVQLSADKHKAELNELTAKLLVSKAEVLITDMAAAEGEFDKGLASMDAAIADVRANGIDPNGVSVDYDGQQTTLVGARTMLLQQKLEALAAIRASHQQILDSIASLGKA